MSQALEANSKAVKSLPKGNIWHTQWHTALGSWGSTVGVWTVGGQGVHLAHSVAHSSRFIAGTRGMVTMICVARNQPNPRLGESQGPTAHPVHLVSTLPVLTAPSTTHFTVPTIPVQVTQVRCTVLTTTTNYFTTMGYYSSIPVRKGERGSHNS